MRNRLRLVMGATALLYLGPLLAGLGGFGWSRVPVFVAIFLLWTLILRPATWPQTAADWARPDLLIGLLTQSVMQVLIVALCFGIGRGLGGVLGVQPAYPVMLPIAVSFLSIPLCRLLWNPHKAAEMDRFLDTAIAGIKAAGAGIPPDRAETRARTDRLLAPLQALPATATEDDIARHLAALLTHAPAEDIARGLIDAAARGTASPAGLRALVLHTTDPAHSAAISGLTAPARAFQLISDDPALTLLHARRSAYLLTEDPDAWWDSVSPDTLRTAAAAMPPEAATALHHLAALTERVAPPDHIPDQTRDHSPAQGCPPTDHPAP